MGQPLIFIGSWSFTLSESREFTHLYKPKSKLFGLMAGVSVAFLMYYGIWLMLFYQQSIQTLEQHLYNVRQSIVSNVKIRQEIFRTRVALRYNFPIASLAVLKNLPDRDAMSKRRQDWLAEIVQQDLSAGLYNRIQIKGRNGVSFSASEGCLSQHFAGCSLPLSAVTIPLQFAGNGIEYRIEIDIARYISSAPQSIALARTPSRQPFDVLSHPGEFYSIQTGVSAGLQIVQHGRFVVDGHPIFFSAPVPFLRWRILEYLVLIVVVNGIVFIISRYASRFKKGFLLLREILQEAPELFWLKGTQGHYLLINRIAAMKLFNLRYDEVIGKTDFDLFGSENAQYAEACTASDRQVLKADDGKTHTSIEMCEPPGRSLALMVSKRIFRDGKEVIGVMGMARDITHEQQARDDLMRVQSVIDVLVNHINAFVYAKDLQHRYVLVNRALCEFHGKPEKWFNGKTDADLYPEPVAQEISRHEESVLSQGDTIELEQELLYSPEGEKYIVKTMKIPTWNNEGHITGLVGISVDVTDLSEQIEELGTAVSFVIQRIKRRTGRTHGRDE